MPSGPTRLARVAAILPPAVPTRHVLFGLLAALCLFTATMSFRIGVRQGVEQERLMDAQQRWSVRRSVYLRLSDLADAMADATGIAVASRDPVTGETRLADARAGFQRNLAAAQRELALHKGAADIALVAHDLERIGGAVEVMGRHCDRALASLRSKRLADATQAAQTMKRSVLLIHSLFDRLEGHVWDVQPAALSTSYGITTPLQQLEFLMLCLVLALVGGIATIAFRLSSRIAVAALERERTLSALRQSEGRFQAFMDNSPVIAALRDETGRFVYTNRSLQRLIPQVETGGDGAPLGELPPGLADDLQDEDVLATGRAVEALATVRVSGEEARHWLVHRFPVLDAGGRPLIGLVGLDVTLHRRAQEAAQRRGVLLEMIHDAVIVTDLDLQVTYCNAAAGRMFGLACEEMIGHPLDTWRRNELNVRVPDIRASVDRQGGWTGDIPFVRADGTEGLTETTVVPLLDEGGERVGYIAVLRDITVRRRLERQVLQSQKMEAIGQLAAGIAHEINTPAQYVVDNVHFLETAFHETFALLDRYANLQAAARSGEPLTECIVEIEKVAQEVDLGFLTAEVPGAIRQSLDGLSRIAAIVRGVKAFAHPGGGTRTDVNLNFAVESAVTVTRNEWKYVADVETHLDPDLPAVDCFAGEINQVILNILVNASHAVADVVDRDSGQRGRIIVTTRRDGDWAEIRVADTGPGIPAAIRSRVFDPFFTTKPLGKGTGQGLALCYRVVVENHGGALTFETAEGKGTTFIVRLPLRGDAALERAA